MEERRLSKFDAWHLLNVILGLYKVITDCYDLCKLNSQQKELLLKNWRKKDKEIAECYHSFLQYGYCKSVRIELSESVFERLYRFIIEEDDLDLAMDFVQPKLYLNYLIQTMQKIEQSGRMKFLSIELLTSLRDFRVEIHKWATVYALRKNTSLNKEMSKRQNMTYSILCKIKKRETFFKDETEPYRFGEKKKFNLSDYFIATYNKQYIARIFQYLNYLNEHKEDTYITKMASLISVVWEKQLLCNTYNNTLKAIFDYYGIKHKVENYKPSRFRRPNYKGNLPLTRLEALKVLQSIESPIVEI